MDNTGLYDHHMDKVDVSFYVDREKAGIEASLSSSTSNQRDSFEKFFYPLPVGGGWGVGGYFL